MKKVFFYYATMIAMVVSVSAYANSRHDEPTVHNHDCTKHIHMVNVAMEPLAAVVLVLNQLQTVKFGSKLIVPIVDTKRVYTSKIFVLSVYLEYPEKPLSE